MSHPIIRALGDYLQLSSAEGLLHALKLEPRRSVLSRTLSSLKLLGTGIVIGRGIDSYAEEISDYATRAAARAHKRTMPRALSTAGALAVGVGLGVGAVVLFAPVLVADLWRGEKSQPSPPSPSAYSPVANAATPTEDATPTPTSGKTTPTSVKAAPTNGATG